MWTCSNEDINRENCNGCIYLIDYTLEKRYECMLLLDSKKDGFIYNDQQRTPEKSNVG